MNDIKGIKNMYSVLTACLIIVGLVLLAIPGIALNAVCIIFGIYLIIYGVVKIIGYFAKDVYQLAFQFDLALGIVAAIVGIVFICKTSSIVQILSTCIGIVMLIDATLKIQTSLDSKRFGISSWWLMLVMAIMVAAVGIMLILMPGETTKVMDKLEDILKNTPEIEHYAKVAGYGLMSGQGTSYGTIIIRLKDWGERKGSEHTSDAVVARLNAQFYGVKEAQIFSFQPGMIPGYGMGNSLELNLQDRTGGDMATFYEAVIQFLGALNQRPEVAMAYTSYAMNFPQVSVDVDAAKCKRAGISPGAVLDALGSYCGGAYISNYNQFGKVYRVMMQASPEYRLDEQALGNMFVRNGTEMAPVSQFVTLNKVLGPETANRFNLYSAIAANVNPAEGYSSGEVQKVIAEVAEQTLPLGYGYEYGGMAREEANTGGAQTVFIYAICIFLIYLILACLYESFLIPFAVIFSVPFGLMGSFLFAKVLGLENNIYLQTGVIMLIGLLAKTAILITEYAIERRRKGMGIVESAYSAAQVRLRPILMTVLTMIFGMLPLMFSSGAGANGNSSLGTGVVGGMLIGTLALLFVVPVFYIIFEYLQEKVRPPMEEEADMQVLLEKQKSEAERAKD